MNIKLKRDLSISMLRANLVALVIGIPVAILQLNLFVALHGALQVKITQVRITRDGLLFFVLLIVSIVVHEWIHGLTWMWVGKQSAAQITYGFQWKTLTSYAHLKGPLEVNAYRIGGFMPGLVLGILPYCLSLLLDNQILLWFGVINTFAAGGDWLILWLLRKLKRGTLVEDHSSRAGCYVLEQSL